MITIALMLMALHFISGSNKGKEFPLRQDHDLVIGRSESGDLVIDAPDVHRKEAIVSTVAGNVWIKTLDPKAEISVNGQKITETSLKEGDRVRMGGDRCMLVTLNRFSSTFQSLKSAPAEPVKPKQDTNFWTRRTIAGTVTEMPLGDLLQFLSHSRKSGILTIKTETETGKIYLREGQIYFASINDNFGVNPVKSLYRLLRWKTGRFELGQGSLATAPGEIKEDSQHLLLEGMRQMDEIARIESEMPPKASTLQLVRPMPQRLRDLSEEELDLVQLALEHGTVAGVLDHYPGIDLEACTHLAALLQRKILVVGGQEK